MKIDISFIPEVWIYTDLHQVEGLDGKIRSKFLMVFVPPKNTFFWAWSNLLNFERLVLQKNDFVAFVHCFSNHQKCKQHRNETVS